MIKPTLSDAIIALGIDGGFKIKDGKVAKWYSEKEQPTEETIQTKLKELEADYDAKKYQRDRAADYPSWQEQMDLLYHGGVDALKAELKKTKDKFPKPE
tara:strand:- start:51 stop:347 length:297 start_codon:yes stop_codon:yes gene_type:complete